MWHIVDLRFACGPNHFSPQIHRYFFSLQILYCIALYHIMLLFKRCWFAIAEWPQKFAGLRTLIAHLCTVPSLVILLWRHIFKINIFSVSTVLNTRQRKREVKHGLDHCEKVQYWFSPFSLPFRRFRLSVGLQRAATCRTFHNGLQKWKSAGFW
jgi:hypothetical protein